MKVIFKTQQLLKQTTQQRQYEVALFMCALMFHPRRALLGSLRDDTAMAARWFARAMSLHEQTQAKAPKQ